MNSVFVMPTAKPDICRMPRQELMPD